MVYLYTFLKPEPEPGAWSEDAALAGCMRHCLIESIEKTAFAVSSDRITPRSVVNNVRTGAVTGGGK